MDSWDTPSWVIEELRSQGFTGDPYRCYGKSQIDAFVASLRACTRNKDLARGTSIHHDLVQRGLLEKCSQALVVMYAKCGELGKAKELIHMHKSSNVVTWTALIAGYAQEGHGQNALDCFEQMQCEGILPDAVTYACILKACATIGAADKGKQIHDEITRQGLLQNDLVLGSALVDMYAKCGAVTKARQVLDGLPSRNVVSWNALIAGYAQEGHTEQALNCFEEMQGEGILPNAVTFICILKVCATIRAADKGKQIHEEIARQGLLQNNIVLGGALVDMYAKCGALSKARHVHDGLHSQNVVSWNALIAGYTQEGHAEQALNCFEEMQCEGILPDAVTFICILKACVTIVAADKGKQIHDEIARQGLLQNNIVLGGALVDMYAKCGAVSKARQVLDELPSRNVVSWSALIAGYAQEGHPEQALNCFEEMQREGILPNAVTYACILKACATIGAADKGKQIHDEIARQGLLENNILLGNALVDMYAKCGAVSKARQVFAGLPSRDVVSWSAMIAGYAQGGHAEQALNSFEEMQCAGIPPDAVTYACILKACATIGAADKGKQIHDEIARQGLLQNDIVLGSALVDMYAKCGAVSEARQVLDGLSSRDVVSWSALIAGYAQEGHAEQAMNCFEEMQREGICPNVVSWNALIAGYAQGHAEQALNCFEEMQHEGILPDAVTFICILKACATIGAADKGKEIHDEIARQGLLQDNIMLGGALVDMYAKCGAVSKAQQVLDGLPSRNVVAWNALIAGYAQEGHTDQSLNCFVEMQREGILPDAVTFICILKACAMIGAADKGKEIHEEIARQGLLENNVGLGGALVDMYAKCGALSRARQVLDELSSRNVVSWNALISGYVQGGHAEQALNCFEEMQHEGILPDAVTFICILRACATIGAADKGKEIHDKIARQGLLQNNVVLGSALVDMYAKCGAVSKARQVLDGLPSRTVVSWNALIAGYAQEGHAEQALNCFEEMQHEGILPDAVTCAFVLNVCSHRGLIEEGQALLVNMSTKYCLNPSLECYTCMVDLFGRAGHLEKAVRLIQDMPSSDYSIIWHTLLGACQKWADVNVGRWAFERAVKLDKSDGPAYVLMTNIYATAGMVKNEH